MDRLSREWMNEQMNKETDGQFNRWTNYMMNE